MSTATAPDARAIADQRKHTCSNCLRGNHPSCTLGGRCQHLDCDKPRSRPSLVDPSQPAPPVSDAHLCMAEGCDREFASQHALEIHRSRMHRDDRTPPAAQPPKSNGKRRPVLIELVDEEPPPPPPPPAPKKTIVEQILELVENADLEAGAWKRCAMFTTKASAKRAATKLAAEAAGYEWKPGNDGRLFVRVPPAGE